MGPDSLGTEPAASAQGPQAQAQQALQRQLEFTQRLTSRVPGLLFQMRRDPRGWFSLPFASDALRSLFALSQEQLRDNAAPLFSRIHPDDYALCVEGLRASGSSLQPWKGQYRVVLPDGTVRWHSSNANPYPEPDGGMSWYGFTQDVTEQKEAADSLRHANLEARLQSNLLEVTLGSLAQGVSQFNAEQRLVYYNQTVVDLLDLPREYLDQRPTLEDVVRFQHARGDFGDVSVDSLLPMVRMSEDPQAVPQTYTRLGRNGRHVEVRTRRLDSGGWVRTYSDVTEHFQAAQALRESEERLQLVLQGSNDGAFDWNIETGEAYFAPRWWEILGLAPNELPSTARLWGEFTHPLDRLRVHSELQAALDEGASSFEIEFRMLHRAGHAVAVLDRGFIVRNAQGNAVRVSGTLSDLTSRKRLERQLEESEARLRTLFEAVPGRLWFKDMQGRFVLCNQEVSRAFGVDQEDALGRTVEDLNSLSEHLVDAYALTDQQALDSGKPVEYEQELPLYAGGPRGTFAVIKRAVFNNAGHPLGVLGVAYDITERKAAEAEVERLAFYDSLTGLCNRRLFHDRLEQAQASSMRSGAWGAVCFIDLDNFKDLNDTQGHDVGDQLLRQVGQRLLKAVREEDTVARLGGDEFVVLLEGLASEDSEAALYANAVGQKMLQALNVPYPLNEFPYHNTPSIGITLFRGHNERIEDILKRADLAMYQSKAAGRNTVRFFDPHMQSVVLQRSALERDLRVAIRDQQFLLHFQPVVHASGRTLGHEALLRWQHPSRGLVSPAEFIPVAEQTGLILPMGQWVLEQACATLAAWSADPVRNGWTLAVNLSARQLRQSDFVPEVQLLLQRLGVRPDRLKLELTESLLLHDIEDTVVKMGQLAELGVRFALDDFGTGYSSLSYLKRLPLSQLKIDQSFVRDLLTDPNDAAIAHTILQLASSLEMDVVAEGVETEGQRERLAAMGCQAFQGYLFGRPGPL
jgi:diguanylate cyclase (GGDEF)-like protein/PAS domain S-box-containing protein